MAREQRKDVDYFPHECAHGRKMHIIESKYGNDGYATWFKLLEQLGKANNHFIDASDESVLMFLASVCRIDEDRLKSILTDLSKLGAIDKILWENHLVIWSQKFVDSVSDAYRKRKTSVPQYSAVLEQFIPKNPPIRAGMAEVIPKVKNSRVEKRKEENIDDRKLKFASTLEPFLQTYGRDLLNDFYKYWTEPNKSGTKFRQELEKTWSLERRLETWAKNDKNFTNGKSNNNNGSNANSGKVSGRSAVATGTTGQGEFA